jgi:type IX secretion system PorP/SprF family membrane protein
MAKTNRKQDLFILNDKKQGYVMKKISFISGILLIVSTMGLFAQQDPMFTQYMTNPITINPAIAGVRQVDNLSLVFRKQWVGIEGAPTTAALSYQGPFFNNKVGLGANLIHDIIGPVVQTGLYAQYAYHLPFDEQKTRNLSLGIMAGFNYYTFDLLSLHADQPDDDIADDGLKRKFLLNFGIGALYHTERFFIGASFPKLVRNSLSDEDNTLTIEDREERHFFLMSGYIFDLSQNIKLKPSIIGRMVNGAPVSLDATATIMLFDKIWFGLTYRVGSSFGGLIRWQINQRFHIGYSFDYFNSRLSSYNQGTHEVFLSIDLGNENKLNSSKRFF